MFSEEQEKKHELTPENHEMDEQELTENEVDADHNDENNSEMLTSYEDQLLVHDEMQVNTICDRVNSKCKDYLLIEPSNKKLRLF